MPDRQPLLRRRGPERGLDLGARAPQPLPGLLRRRRRAGCYIGDVGGNDDVDRQGGGEPRRGGRQLRLARTPRAPAPRPAPSPLYSYPHNGRDAAITGGFVYHGTQFPASYQGSYFFADYAQNWIRRLTFDANGNVNGVFNFEPADGTVDGPYGDIVYLTEGPDGALYYVDLGYSDITGTFGVSKIRRIRYVAVEPAAGRRPPRPIRPRARRR